jgi:hypothetical protein
VGAAAQADYQAFTQNPGAGGDANRKARLENAGIREKIDATADPADNENKPIDGSEFVAIFDDDSANPAPAAQQVPPGKGVMVVPSSQDMFRLWGIGTYADRDKISREDFAELGRYVLKKCR